MNQLEVAQLLVETGCLSVSPNAPFTYASGLRGPLYCDNRKILSFVKERRIIFDSMIQVVKTQDLSFDSFAGLATGGIPHAAWCAEKMERPMIYIRSRPKGHGQKRQVEGLFKEGQVALLIEDLVNQGSSLIDAVVGARKDGLVINDCITIVDYQMPKAIERVKDLGIKLHALTNLDAIMMMAKEKLKMSGDELAAIERWQLDPLHWEQA